MVTLIFDVDDVWEGHDGIDLLQKLKQTNPLLRVTAFAVPTRCSDEYIDALPPWVGVSVHGWEHGDPPADGGEWKNWSYERTWELIYTIEARSPRWQRLAKAPGWVISTEAMQAFADADWALADQHYNDGRRPVGLRVHCEGDGDHVHTHVQNVCNNGLEETWPRLLAAVRDATSFDLVSDAVQAWQPAEVPA